MTARIAIDMDARCPVCGKKGAVNGGLCIECLYVRITALLKGRACSPCACVKNIEKHKKLIKKS